ncbi:hypothetical protein JTB14_003268 [Gonioctena quinquepunctata]|nr:hypothetical protein JTB14_003268 [Gonioctena quinquepunctata]
MDPERFSIQKSRSYKVSGSEQTQWCRAVNIRPFDGTGFENWRFRVERLLKRNIVLNSLSRDTPTEDGAALKEFEKDDAKALDLIVLCIADTVIELIKAKKRPKHS